MNKRPLAVFAVLACISCNGNDTTPAATSYTVTPEPPGANCANGGVSITVSGADPQYVCNGADGATGNWTVTPEPAGANCASGGFAVTSPTDGTTRYLCNGGDGTNGTNGADGSDGADGQAGAPGTNGVAITVPLCPNDMTLSTAGDHQQFAAVTGAVQGLIPGSATTPDGATGQLAVVATCSSFAIGTDSTTGATTDTGTQSAFAIVTPIDDPLAQLYTVLANDETLTVRVRDYSVPSGADPQLTWDLSLRTAKLRGIEMITASQPGAPAIIDQYVRMWLIFDQMKQTFADADGTSAPVTETPTAFAPFSLATDCEILEGASGPVLEAALFMSDASGPIVGEGTLQTGAVDLVGVCQGIKNVVAPTSPTGALMSAPTPLVFIKQADATSPLILTHTFAITPFNTFEVRYLRNGTEYLNVKLLHATVVSYESFDDNGVHYERIGVDYDSIRIHSDGPDITTIIDWAPPA